MILGSFWGSKNEGKITGSIVAPGTYTQNDVLRSRQV
jgi:hypothetical protein